VTTAPAWGTTETVPEHWQQGAWTLARHGDELTDLTFAGRPVLRSVRAVVRDRDWRTVPPEVTSVDSTDGLVRIGLRFAGLGADLRGSLTVSPHDDGLAVELALRSFTAFERNRIGLVVLHAAEVAGAPLTIEHADGTRSDTRFPTTISPHQPAMAIRALRWTARGATSRLVLDGEVFEMEDQRNWTDASFKTYSTPLSEPFPVLVREGDEIRQRLELTARVDGPDAVPAVAAAIVLVPRGSRLPAFTVGATTEPGTPPPAGGPVLLVEIDAERPGWQDVLARAVLESGGAGVDVRIVADRPASVDAVVRELARLVEDGVPVVRAAVFSSTTHTSEPGTWAALRDGTAAAALPIALAGGTRAHFTELNRGLGSLPADLPGLTFSSTPQMHAVETRQVVESVDIQRLTAEEAVRIAAGRPVHVGPVSLLPRFNAVATSRPAGEAEPAPSDQRQTAAALATWIVASAAAFSVPGVASVSWFEAAGPRGLRTMDGDDLPVRRGALAVLALSEAPALDAIGSPPGVHVLAGSLEGRVVALAASLRDEAVTVLVGHRGAEQSAVLPPFGFARLEWPAG
jgi:hypothetical protein